MLKNLSENLKIIAAKLDKKVYSSPEEAYNDIRKVTSNIRLEIFKKAAFSANDPGFVAFAQSYISNKKLAEDLVNIFKIAEKALQDNFSSFPDVLSKDSLKRKNAISNLAIKAFETLDRSDRWKVSEALKSSDTKGNNLNLFDLLKNYLESQFRA